MADSLPEWMLVEDDGWDTDIIEDTPGYDFYNGTVKLFFDAGPHIYFRFDEEGNRINVDGCTTVLDVINKPFLKSWAAKVAIEYVKDQMLLPNGSFKPYSTEEFMAILHEAKGQHKVHLDKAGDIGHIAHNVLEASIRFAIKHTDGIILELKELPTEDTPANGMAINCAKHALKWAQDHNVRWLATERKVYSRSLDVAGTMDGLAIVDSCADPECKGCCGRILKDRKAVIDFKSSNQLADSYAYQVSEYLFAYIEEFGEYIPDRWVLRLGKTEGDFESWYLPDETFELDLNAFISALGLYRSLKEITQRRQEDGRKFRAIVKARRDSAREAKEEQERLERLEAKKQRMAATAARNAEKEFHYKLLRSEGWSAADAKAETSLKFPKAEKEDKVENQSSQSKTGSITALKSKTNPQVASEDPDVEFVVNL